MKSNRQNFYDFIESFKFLFFFSREGNHPNDYSRLTYKKLREEVCKFANVLKSKGVTKGDRVAIYMPMILEIIVAVLACTRIGAVHSIVVSLIRKSLKFFGNYLKFFATTVARIYIVLRIVNRKTYYSITIAKKVRIIAKIHLRYFKNSNSRMTFVRLPV